MNIILLLCHLSFAIWYWNERMMTLFYYNLFSIALFTFGFILIRRNQIKLFAFLNYAEITVFMTLNTLMLGWDYGFEFYAFGLLVSSFMVQVQLSDDRRVKSGTVIYAVLIAVNFLVMRLWLYEHDPVYPILPVHRTMYFMNAVLVLSMLISFTMQMLRTSRELEMELSYVAEHDALTDLPNRRKVTQEIYSVKPSWIAIMDLDWFKSINDRFGHRAGDEVLKTTAQILQDFSTETGASVGRFGGEEFILYGKKEMDSARQLDHLRQIISAQRIPFDQSTLSFTVTFGLCSEGNTTESMLHTADERLYQGKVNGRTQLVC